MQYCTKKFLYFLVKLSFDCIRIWMLIVSPPLKLIRFNSNELFESVYQSKQCEKHELNVYKSRTISSSRILQHWVISCLVIYLCGPQRIESIESLVSSAGHGKVAAGVKLGMITRLINWLTYHCHLLNLLIADTNNITLKPLTLRKLGI